MQVLDAQKKEEETIKSNLYSEIESIYAEHENLNKEKEMLQKKVSDLEHRSTNQDKESIQRNNELMFLQKDKDNLTMTLKEKAEEISLLKK